MSYFTRIQGALRATQPRVFLITLLVALVMLGLGVSVWPRAERTEEQNNGTNPLSLGIANLPLQFEPNAGQFLGLSPNSGSSVRFSAHTDGGTLYFAPSEVVLAMPAPGGSAGTALASKERAAAYPKQAQASSAEIVRLHFLGSMADPAMTSDTALPGLVSYFHGKDPTHWHTGLPTYAGITYERLYPGVDLRYNGTHDQLKGTYTIAPGASADRIRWRYDGVHSVTLDAAGNLQILVDPATTPQGSPLALTEYAPTAWQEIAGRRIPVSAHYVLGQDDSIGFALGAYDPTFPLVLDPYLTYSSFLGGSDGDLGRAITVDSAGYIYVTGDTLSLDFPTVDPLQPSNYGVSDIFVSKYSPDGSQLIYSTYIGGASYEEGKGIVTDSQSNVYLTGDTGSSFDFPLVNAFQPVFGGGVFDSYVLKLAASGQSILFSSYLGGNNEETGMAIALDGAGAAYLAGETPSTNFPVTGDAFQPHLAGDTDAYLTKVSASGALLYSTYLGGSRYDGGGGSGMNVALDGAGDIYLAGDTQSTNFPTTSQAFQRNNGGGTDVFVAKFDPTATTLLYSTYLGGSGDDGSYGNHMAVDASGNAYVSSDTMSTNFPLANPFQPNLRGTEDAFVAKLNPSGSALVYSTYLGGYTNDEGYGIAVDSAGEAFAVGSTHSSSGFPLVNALQNNYGGDGDAFVTEFNAAGSAPVFSTYLGGSFSDYGDAITTHGGAAYLTGMTRSSNFPLSNAFQPIFAGDSDAFLTIISDQPPNTPTPTITGTPPTATPTACGANNDYSISVSTGATIVPGITDIGNHCDDCYTVITLPFAVNLYGRSFTQATLSSNGNLQFLSRNNSYDDECPPLEFFSYMIMPYWDDLDTGYVPGDGIYTSISGTAPDRVFNIEWRACNHYIGDCTGRANFELRVYESSPTQQFDVVYGRIDDNGTTAVVGVQKDEGSRYTVFDCSSGGLAAGMKLTFTLPACGNVTPTVTATAGTPDTPTATPTCSPAGNPGPWTLGNVGPQARGYGGGTSDGSSVYIYGGRTYSVAQLRDLWRWDPANGSWTQLADMPDGRALVQGTYYGGKIYVPGGLDDNGAASTESSIYDVAANTWSTGAPLPAAREGIGVAAYNGKVYVFGSYNSQEPPLPTLIYDIANNSWTAGAPIPSADPVTGGRAITVGSYIYYAGGYGIGSGSLDTLYRYDPADDSWVTLAPMEQPRGNEELMTDGSYIFAVNGGNTNGVPVPAALSVEAYDISANSWSIRRPTVQGTVGQAGGMAQGQLMIQGGTSGGYTNLVQIAPLGVPCVTGTPPTAPATQTPTRTGTPTATPPPGTAAITAMPSSTTTPAPTQTPGGPSATPMPANTSTPSLATTTPTVCAITFTDVDVINPFYGYIRCLACRGIISGYPDGTFRPGNNVTRGQVAKIVGNAAGFGEGIPDSQQTFTDVPHSNPFWLWIERVAGRGIISGYPCGGGIPPGSEPCDPQHRPYFRWGANATRGQISKIVSEAKGLNDPIPADQQTFADVAHTNTFWLWIERLAHRQIISGYQCGGPGEPCDPESRAYFRPSSNAARGQVSKMVADTFFPQCQTP